MAKSEDKKKIAQKLVDLPKTSEYFGDPNASGLKKFISKHPVEVMDEPYDNEDDMYNASKTTKDTSKEKTRKLAVSKVSERGIAYEEHMTPAQKRRREALVKKMKGHFTGYGKDNEKVMYATATKRAMRGEEVELGEELLNELGEPMSPAPATSDNPSNGNQNAGPDAGDGTMDDQDNKGDNDGESQEVQQAKEFLETIAMNAAEAYESMPKSVKIPGWVLEKLELASNFVTSAAEAITDSIGAEDEEEGEAEGGNPQDQSQTQKPSAFKGGQGTVAKEESEVAAKAVEKYGSRESGEPLITATTWKHIKR